MVKLATRPTCTYLATNEGGPVTQDGGVEKEQDEERLVGSDRVLAVLIELAQHPTGITLDDLAQKLQGSKSTVHRALASLRRARLARQLGRGVYVLGDDFFRLAFLNHADRPEGILIEPILQELAQRYGETTHYAVLDGTDVVYRAKVDPPQGGVRLTSVVGGRNPAYYTAVGKLLMSYEISSEQELRNWLGTDVIPPRTPHSITTVRELWKELQATKERGFAIDDQESELGVNCVAVPVRMDHAMPLTGGVSVSALAFRLPLERLVAQVPDIQATVNGNVQARTST
jgi:IclR family transcriptional regulator, acetate operon repressor